MTAYAEAVAKEYRFLQPATPCWYWMKIVRQLQIATPAGAEFSVRVELDGPGSGCEISGRAVGPNCPGISTVEVAYPMTVAGASDTTVSLRCAIPEPNLWRPDVRFTYAVSVSLKVNGELVDSRVNEIALKSR